MVNTTVEVKRLWRLFWMDRDLDLNSTSLKCFHNPDHMQTPVGLVGSALWTVRPEWEESREECGSLNEWIYLAQGCAGSATERDGRGERETYHFLPAALLYGADSKSTTTSRAAIVCMLAAPRYSPVAEWTVGPARWSRSPVTTRSWGAGCREGWGARHTHTHASSVSTLVLCPNLYLYLTRRNFLEVRSTLCMLTLWLMLFLQTFFKLRMNINFCNQWGKVLTQGNPNTTFLWERNLELWLLISKSVYYSVYCNLNILYMFIDTVLYFILDYMIFIRSWKNVQVYS